MIVAAPGGRRAGAKGDYIGGAGAAKYTIATAVTAMRDKTKSLARRRCEALSRCVVRVYQPQVQPGRVTTVAAGTVA